MQSIRKYLIILFTASSAGLLLELYLLGHYEDVWQLVPIGLLVLAMLVGLLELFYWRDIPGRFSAYFSYLLMAAAVAGVILHYQGNRAFELEMYPDLKGWNLVKEVLTGATPALSPATLLILGFVGWIYSRIPRKNS